MNIHTLLKPDSLTAPTWGDQLLAFFEARTDDTLFPRIEAARQACQEGGVLHDPAAIKHPKWAAIVRGCIDATPLMADIAADLQGDSAAPRSGDAFDDDPFDDDEDEDDMLEQAWGESYVTVYEVATLLANKATYNHPAWTELCIALLDKSSEQGNEFDVAEVLVFTVIDNGGDWPALVPAYLKAAKHDFIGAMLTRDEVLSHPDLLTWLDPYKDYVMMLSAVTNPTTQQHPVFAQLVDLIKAQPNIRTDHRFARFAEVVNAKLGAGYVSRATQ